MRAIGSQEHLLADLALLSALSVLVHYCFGLAGVAVAAISFALLEHGTDVATAVLDRGAQCLPILRGDAFAVKAASAVAAIRRRRATKTSLCNGSSAHSNHPTHNTNARASHHRTVGDHDQHSHPIDPTAIATSVVSDHHSSPNNDRSHNSVEPTDVSSVHPPVPFTSVSHRLEIRDVECNRNVPLNAHAPIAFETDLFVGHVYFFVRTTPLDPHWSHLFAHRRRTVWLQVQGRFKRAPRGTVFLGGELPAAIAPGLLTRSVATVILRIVQSLVPRVVCSFGDAHADVVPSIALPLFQSADQLIHTPAGATPPPLGARDFGELETARQQRRATPLGSEEFIVGDTYSFDFHTMYVDLVEWQVVNLPGLRSMDLGAFFGALPLRIVAYDVVMEADETQQRRHCQPLKRYLFHFEVANRTTMMTQSQSNRLELLTASDRIDSSDSDDTTTTLLIGTNTGTGGASSSTTNSAMSTVVSDASSIDDLQLLDTIDYEQHANAQRLRRLRELTFGGWMEQLDVASGVRRVHFVFLVQNESLGDEDDVIILQKPVQLAVVSAYALRTLLLSHYKRLSKRVTPHDQHHRDVLDALAPLTTLRFHSQSRLQSYATISDEAAVIAACLSALLTLKQQQLDAPDDVDDDAFDAQLFTCLTTHLQLQGPTLTPSQLGVNWSQRDRTDRFVVCDGVVLRFLTQQLLRQEVLVVTIDELLFYRSYARTPDKRVEWKHVIQIDALSAVPLGRTSQRVDAAHAHAFGVQIVTIAETIVLSVTTAAAQTTWLQVLAERCAAVNAHAQEEADDDALVAVAINARVNQPLQPTNRIVLNTRTLFPCQLVRLDDTSSDAIDDDRQAAAAGVAAVASALTRALELHAYLRPNNRKSNNRMAATLAFLDAASALRSLDLRAAQRSLPHEALLALYLNLYHVVFAHALLTHTIPRTERQWRSFVTTVCYSIGLDGDSCGPQLVLSLADIEHALLRKRMTLPDVPFLSLHGSAANAKAAAGVRQLRQQQLAALGVQHPDFRIMFALAMLQQPLPLLPHRSIARHSRCATVIADVVVYTPQSVHAQLNVVAQRALQHGAVTVDKRRDGTTILTLPRVCEWYRLDFGGSGSPLFCVRKLLGFLDDGTQQLVLEALDEPLALRIQFRAFAFVPPTALRHLDIAVTSVDDRTDDSVAESVAESVADSADDSVVDSAAAAVDSTDDDGACDSYSNRTDAVADSVVVEGVDSAGTQDSAHVPEPTAASTERVS